MGRPAMKVARMTVRLPETVGAKIDVAAGKSGRRADYIRKAVDAALAADARAQKAKAKPKRAASGPSASKSAKKVAARSVRGKTAVPVKAKAARALETEPFPFSTIPHL